MMDATKRFSSRVAAYLKYRPHYPQAVIETLQRDCLLTPEAVVADVGSGTGFLSELFLANNNLVFGVEPNREMRLAGETYCQQYPNFRSVDGTAESTTLADESIDFVVAGQAFHWFDRAKARQEFLRILKPKGWGVLIWNDRDTQSTPFAVEYEQLLQDYATDYRQVNHKQLDDSVFSEFFGHRQFLKTVVDYSQLFDYDALLGRLMSTSYAPEKGHLNYAPMLARLADIFRRHSNDGRIDFDYKTRLFFGQLRS